MNFIKPFSGFAFDHHFGELHRFGPESKTNDSRFEMQANQRD
jgi:hypothetical protein